MALSLADVAGLAALTRLEISPEEQEGLREQLGAVLEYVNRLAQIDTTGVPDTEGGQQAFVGRLDELVERDPRVRELVLQNFPDSLGGALRVPAVFENPKG